MSSFHIKVISETNLKLAMQLGFTESKHASHFLIRPAGEEKEKPYPRLIFLWSGVKDAVPFPFRADCEYAADFAQRWLNEVDYGPEPDHDGCNSKGWRLYNDRWGRVEDMLYSIVAVTPCWIEHGK